MTKSAFPTPMQLTDAELAEAKELDRPLMDAMSRKDPEAPTACFWNSPDLVVVLWGNCLRGAGAVRNSSKRLFDQNESPRLECREVTRLPSSDELAVPELRRHGAELKRDGPRLADGHGLGGVERLDTLGTRPLHRRLLHGEPDPAAQVRHAPRVLGASHQGSLARFSAEWRQRWSVEVVHASTPPAVHDSPPLRRPTGEPGSNVPRSKQLP